MVYYKVLWIFLASSAVVASALSAYKVEDIEDNEIYEHGGREGKILFPFVSIVRFANTECSSSGSMSGTCLARRECNNLNGTITGTCASRRGRCCVENNTRGVRDYHYWTEHQIIALSLSIDWHCFVTNWQDGALQRSCGSTTNVNNTYFVSPGYPSAYSGGQPCTIIVNRCNSDICQLRIDFLDLVLAQPDGDGNCDTDSVTITGGNTVVPVICGDNTGQTLFVDFDATSNSAITITIAATLSTSFSRRWNVKLTQLGCDCPGIAPNGCLQYYTGTSGTITSFNYGSAGNTELSESLVTGTRQIANLNYGICIRMEAGYCAIQYAQSSGTYSFTVTGDVEGADDTVLGTSVGAVNDGQCVTDFVVVPNPIAVSTGQPVGTDRFCGLGFVTIQSASKPFVMYVITNGNEGATATTPPDVANRGFSLGYTQVAC